MELWMLAGGLSLARMRPILEVSGTSRMEEIDDIIVSLGASDVREYSEKIAKLESWRREIGPLEDSSAPTYFQSTAAGVAILAISREISASDREWRIESSVGNFWSSCDDLLHAGGGYLRPEFRGVSTTLRGVENIWREGDLQVLSVGGPDAINAYNVRLAKIRSNYAKRREIAQVFAECAGWHISA
ncbi:hypothetical protein ACFVVU_26780 [Kitasatospora sp. NPDC057965]|uniref:hypothetical protein n=1 Tax=Kitasatospora sp. NPDC057965 TaxID=3346291 RepID=UPI0036DC3660